MIIKRLVVGELSANCYIVGSRTSGKGLVIDPGGDAGDIAAAIDAAGLDIQIIVLTHGHSDHIAALYEVQKKTGAQVAIHAADAQVLHGRGTFSTMFGISYRTPSPPDRLLKKGDVIEFGGLRFSVLHTPGHTPGSICLLSGGAIFTGDTLFRLGIGSTFTSGSSRRQLLESIKATLMTLPDDTAVYPGHGRETTIGAERRANPLLNGSYI